MHASWSWSVVASFALLSAAPLESQTAPILLGVEIAQESAPGAGDFAANPLGLLLVEQLAVSAAAHYAYGAPAAASFNGSFPPTAIDECRIAFAETSDGLTLFVVHDSVLDGGGGRAETIVDISGDADGAVRAVVDDQPGPDDSYSPAAIDSHFTAAQAYGAQSTDGFALADLEGNWSLVFSFGDADSNAATPAIGGLSGLSAVSADGSITPLGLVLGQRVRLKARYAQPSVGLGGPVGYLQLDIEGDDLSLPGAFATVRAFYSAPPRPGGGTLAPLCLFANLTLNPVTWPTGGQLISYPFAFEQLFFDDLTAGLVLNIGPTGVGAPVTIYVQGVTWDTGNYEFSNGVALTLAP